MPTLMNLIESTQTFKPVLFINADRVYIEQLNISRSKGTHTILFSAISKDRDSPAGRTCQIQMVCPKHVNIEQYRPSIAKDRALVRSSSPWYKYAFGYNNKLRSAHFGTVSEFKVTGTGHPINPLRYPGLDKHLIALIRALRDNKLITT
jgi:hypothetical protein